MKTQRAWKNLLRWQPLGPYLLIEMLMPGGTLVALALWLSRRMRRAGLDASPQALARPVIEAKPLPCRSVERRALPRPLAYGIDPSNPPA